jgi:hypothetical protein
MNARPRSEKLLARSWYRPRQRRKSASIRQSLKSLLEKFEAVKPSQFLNVKGFKKKWPGLFPAKFSVIDERLRRNKFCTVF